MLPLTAEVQASLLPRARPELSNLQLAPAQVGELNGFIHWLLAPSWQEAGVP